MGFFDKIRAGLSKTRSVIAEKLDAVVKVFRPVDEELLDELEEALILSDLGVDTVMDVMDRLRAEVREGRLRESTQVRDALARILAEMTGGTDADARRLKLGTSPSVVLVIGVNGAGKTTTIGKLAHNLKSEGKSVLLAAGDTFRAAAADQLEIWAGRAGVDIVRQTEGADPAAVVFDALAAAKARGTDVVLVDTAGRLQNKANLMKELEKISRVIDKTLPGADRETLLVLDGTTGQNALSQAKAFAETAGITGIVLTKLDGTAKGGVVISISHSMGIPVKYIGVGEQIDDLLPFDPDDFVKALF
ncbi:MAG: signal recognition particle-docking protein FtsY [Clostridiaceae bacterium]|nr:signal recognition particle-docking protein FtsY [Clostridiaceae bacterium]MDY3070851.1 signal recognition particle-docking protein FtsY [Eubacteriales bacterium]MDY3287113.1 signal recognition particle-docking protein FtsY [Eubacteriales bacterium]MDY5016128.1 signal recognition particle-docking protein FtsY [Eubacteriales bacterium]